jgi:hypothetical protein
VCWFQAFTTNCRTAHKLNFFTDEKNWMQNAGGVRETGVRALFMPSHGQHTEIQLCRGIDEHFHGLGQTIAGIISRMNVKVRR